MCKDGRGRRRDRLCFCRGGNLQALQARDSRQHHREISRCCNVPAISSLDAGHGEAAGTTDGSFPLTPALSLRERTHGLPTAAISALEPPLRAGTSGRQRVRDRIPATTHLRLPRPARHERGEGRGEGCFDPLPTQLDLPPLLSPALSSIPWRSGRPEHASGSARPYPLAPGQGCAPGGSWAGSQSACHGAMSGRVFHERGR